MNLHSQHKHDITHLDYRPSKPYPYDIEVFRLSDLRRRSGALAMRRTYSYDFFILILVTEGRTIQFVDFEAIPCGPGTFFVLRPGQAHNFGQEDAWDGWMILVRPEFLLPTPSQSLPAWDIEFLPSRVDLDEGELHRAEDTIRRIRDDGLIDTGKLSAVSASDRVTAHVDNTTADVHALLRYQFYALVAWIGVLHGKRQQHTHDGLPNGVLQRFNKFRNLVEERFSSWNQLSDYARCLACTEKSLTRATTAVVGINAKTFISRRINLEAKRLLAHTSLPIVEIAEKLGFQEPTHFSKFFKREAGCTPKQFRTRSSFPATV
ncbi:transcriptional regulator [Ensifer adhaerens]|uniref:Transcriptional regulator n=1 Tax=Ensifer adhaerens TaxID=106592 RepID=A0A0L8BI28_ENSAD|nr:helix-turn-helix transcriptional regulator [Ensifer adhaerens]KOF14366.1 transcriptional regulator [Ensifer adhaerens]